MFTELWQGLKKPTEPEQLLIDYKEVFGSEAGKRVLHDIEKKTTFSRSALPAHGPIDMENLLKEEAQRSLFLYIIKKINAIPKETERKVQNEQHD